MAGAALLAGAGGVAAAVAATDPDHMDASTADRNPQGCTDLAGGEKGTSSKSSSKSSSKEKHQTKDNFSHGDFDVGSGSTKTSARLVVTPRFFFREKHFRGKEGETAAGAAPGGAYAPEGATLVGEDSLTTPRGFLAEDGADEEAVREAFQELQKIKNQKKKISQCSR